jgi:cell division septal protein FtsQ
MKRTQASVPRPRRPAALRPGARPGGGVRHTRPVKRASAGLTPVRAGALLALLAAAAGLYGVAASDAFALRGVEFEGMTWTSRASLGAALAVPPGSNAFTIATEPLARRLEGLPAVRGATVSVVLPDTLRVVVDERLALVAWQVGGSRFVVDGTGFLFGQLEPDDPAAAGLPIVDDHRVESGDLGVGARLDPVSLDAALRIGSLTPAQVGSGARRLAIRIDDAEGFSITAEPTGWTAVFGFYTPTLRTTDLIPGQVRLLRSLLLGQEEKALRIVLADDRSGTFVPRPTPTAAP